MSRYQMVRNPSGVRPKIRPMRPVVPIDVSCLVKDFVEDLPESEPVTRRDAELAEGLARIMMRLP